MGHLTVNLCITKLYQGIKKRTDREILIESIFAQCVIVLGTS